jgi:hypothetical protein
VSSENREWCLRSSIKQHRQARVLTLGKLLIFYFLVTSLGPALWLTMRWLGLQSFGSIVIDSDLYALLWIPLAYAFDPSIFENFWHFPANAWPGISFLLLLQCIIMSVSRAPAPPRREVVGALLIAPVVEELARAVTMNGLMARINSFWAVLIASVFWAMAHNAFWIPLTQQIVLSTIFVKTRRAIPAVIAAHFLMNVMATIYPQLHILYPRVFV